jgi:hypothetical protein
MTDEKELTTKDVPTVNVTVKYLDALRQAVGLHIDPETAEVDWIFAQTLDPYGDFPNLPEEHQQVGREYFARSPGGGVWIWFGDLPEATCDALWKKRREKEATRDALWKKHREKQGLPPEDPSDEVPF